MRGGRVGVRDRVRVGVGSKLEVSVLVVDQNFAELSGEIAP
jgi:hypothetical protein